MLSKKIIWLFLCLCLAIFVWRYGAELAQIRITETWLLIPATLAAGFSLLLNGVFNLVFFKHFGIRLLWVEWMGLSVINSLGNLLAPLRGGTISNAIYLKKRHGLTYGSFIGSIAATYLMVFFVNGSLGLLALNIVTVPSGEVMLLKYLMASVALGSLLWMFLAPKIPAFKNRIFNFLSDALNSWVKIRSSGRTVATIFFISLGNGALAMILNYCLFRILGSPIGWDVALVLSVTSAFAALVNITPSNLGVREALYGLIGSLFLVPMSMSVVVSLVERCIYLVLSVGLGFLFSGRLTLELKKKGVPE
jgi:uncharacterized membrane protein YbhN (UPF0104 family)